jgi:hypothetical protein
MEATVEQTKSETADVRSVVREELGQYMADMPGRSETAEIVREEVAVALERAQEGTGWELVKAMAKGFAWAAGSLLALHLAAALAGGEVELSITEKKTTFGA